MPQRERTPLLYLAPWIDFGGSDKNTIDWFRGIDQERFAPSLITTQPSPNRRLNEIEEFVEEIWVLPDLMPSADMPAFIFDFVHSRGVRVVHLMNSRLGFDLLPDFRSLPNPPGIVVQLHAEEADKSGYVRYVTTRYEAFVDRFSLTMVDLENAVHEYGVPAEKTKVIYIGVDGEVEFSPERVEPIDSLQGDRMHVIFPARLVHQKDPLLMVEVAAALRDRGVAFQIHALGEGDLEEDVRAAIAEHGLEQHVLIHPPTPTPERWYAAGDAMLLTSVFEGIPAALFEAMAMQLPVVSPALPGHVELLGEEYDGLVEPRDSIAGYVEALAHLAEDETYKTTRGRELRERALNRFSLQRMADEHGELYDEVLARLPPSTTPAVANPAPAPDSRPPALSIISLQPASGAMPSLDGQTRAEAELIAADASSIPIEALRDAGEKMRGGIAVVTSLAAAALLEDPAFVEKVMRRFGASDGGPDAIAFVDAGDDGHYSFRALPADEAGEDPLPHTVAWRLTAEAALPRGLHADPAGPVESLVRLFSGNGAEVEWRHLPGSAPAAAVRSSAPSSWQPLPRPEATAEGVAPSPPVPSPNGYEIPRWKELPTWIPTLSVAVTRYRERGGERRIVSSEPPPAGFEAEHTLGALRTTSPLGTELLLRVGDDYLTVPPDEAGHLPDDAEQIGHFELAPFPQLDCIALAVHRASGKTVPVTMVGDPIFDEVNVVRALGFVEPVPLKPDRVPDSGRNLGLRGLVKAVDQERRCHRYAIGSVPDGELVGELGALAESELGGSIPVWIVDGRLLSERHAPPARRPAPAEVARWALEPVTWGGIATVSARVRTTLRRTGTGAGRLTRGRPRSLTPTDPPAAWLFAEKRPGLVELHAAYHPVTGDQLLTRSAQDAREMGYGDPELLGYIRLSAPVTGDLTQAVFPVPWARRFGAVPRDG